MKKSIKILCVSLVMILLITAFTLPAFAASNSGNWSVVYTNSTQGNNPTDFLYIYSSGAGYNANCTKLNGTASFHTLTVSSNGSTSHTFSKATSRDLTAIDGAPNVVTFTCTINYVANDGTAYSEGKITRK